MTKACCPFTVMFLLLFIGASIFADEPGEPMRASKGSTTFGLKSEGITSPAMGKAVKEMHAAGIVPQRKSSLTFFRWTNATPPKLAHLGLWGENVDDEVFSLIAVLPDVEHVSIYETSITNEGMLALLKLPKLRSLSIVPIGRYQKAGFGPTQWSYPFMKQRANRPRISGEVLADLTKISTLESLNLLDAQVVSDDLKALAHWPKLSSLALPNTVDAETVEHLQACHRLDALTLGEREVTAHELEQLAGWRSLRKLTILNAKLSNEALSALAKLETVEEVQLENCGLTDEDLVHLRPASKLTSLGLARNEIAGAALSPLAKLQLKSLGLEFNNISDATLDRLLTLTTIESLRLSNCQGVTNQGLQSGTLQEMTHLKSLNLRGLKAVNDESISSLVKMSYLRHINIRQTKISQEGVEKMKAAMPGTDVFK